MMTNLVSFVEDIAGRVRNTSLPLSKGLLPLFEAISNSIDAIEENTEQNGSITIKVKREEGTLFRDEEERNYNAITGFEIEDSGIGFTTDNYLSFFTADSLKKVQYGGKGVGRFMWLKAFDAVEIDSEYQEGEMYFSRKFSFSLSSKNDINAKPAKISQQECNKRTIVALLNLREEYKRYYPSTIEQIGSKIIEHFLGYFITGTMPQIAIIDLDGKSLCLNTLYTQELNSKATTTKFKIFPHEFTLTSILLKQTKGKSHELNLCAKKRVVESHKLKDSINDLPYVINFNDQPSIYFGFIESDYFETHCNQERTRLDISDEKDFHFPEELSRKEILEQSYSSIRNLLKPHIEPITKEKKRKINEYINKEAPQYRPIINKMPEKLDSIKFNGTDLTSLDVQLHKIYLEMATETWKKGQEIIGALDSDTKLDEYEAKVREYIDSLDDINKSDLARYVGHRRAVIQFLKYCRGRDEAGKLKLEDTVHNLIYPMGRTSNTIGSDMHNLWLIDERLSFHRYLASDKKISSYEILENKCGKEPDVAIFNEKILFAEDPPVGSVILLEFKRPGRDDYTAGDNPIEQLLEYVLDIRDGKCTDSKGSVVEFPETTPFYCYCIADITSTLRRIIKKKNMIQMPDGQGYYFYQDNIRTYIEVLSFTKIINDAEKRNKILFEKLGLPLNIL